MLFINSSKIRPNVKVVQLNQMVFMFVKLIYPSESWIYNVGKNIVMLMRQYMRSCF